MNWNQIKDIEITELKKTALPVRITLTRNDNSKVCAGGTDLCEAVQTLFSTAGFGRPDVSVLAKLLKERLTNKVNYFIINKIVAALLLKEE